MDIFNLFGKEQRTKSERRDIFDKTGISNNEDKKNPVMVFKPLSYDDVEKIIDTLKLGQSAIVHLNELKTETAMRILDILSGAIYALGGGVYEMEKNIFMFSPSGLQMN